ncbi:alpha-tubulin N-acetyltransferase-like [Histomonas meleagridis]|uniref:alpha-tubulin N-acetyltransferase-like n=1 Tax=Histomonas meleagridis TaxID=135588 RepID=UPI00355A4E2F|nr:alpha-tubulin N-acetyltransferase-like [Histomonas meleagridis]KAH0797227.1 alpha-tubulin N-acetyltransferase-like [Histomonas meleagridis]
MKHKGIRYLNVGEDGIAILKPEMCKKPNADLVSLINDIGIASSKAQGLSHIITTFSTFTGGDNTLYILVNQELGEVLGFVKVGYRHLFLWDRVGQQHETETLCLLDFFTYPSQQRKGFGRKLIDRMLSDQGLEMSQIPIDRPSALCFSFMKKHFGLSEYLPQANKFVVFDQYWETKHQFIEPHSLRVQQPMTPQRKQPQNRLLEPPLHARTPQRKTGYNPITWEPYD